MERGFGIEAPAAHHTTKRREAARYLILIESGGSAVARLCLESREAVTEFDAATEEVVSMIDGLEATRGAEGPEWDRALAGHSAQERAAARVYRLSV